MIYFSLIIEFLKVGTFAIGGYSTIAVITDLMIKNGFSTIDELSNIIGIAESTPGSIAVNIATYIGAKKAGIIGSIVATIGEVLPAFVIIIMASIIMDKIIHNKVVDNAFSIIRPAMTGIIVCTGLSFLLKNVFSIKKIQELFYAEKIDIKNIVIFLLVFFLAFFYKRIRKKEINTIFLIIASAFLGIIINFVM